MKWLKESRNCGWAVSLCLFSVYVPYRIIYTHKRVFACWLSCATRAEMEDEKGWPDRWNVVSSLVIPRETARIVLLNRRRAFERIFKIARLILPACYIIVFFFATRASYSSSFA